MSKLLNSAALATAAAIGLFVSAPASAASAFDATARSSFAFTQPASVETGADSWQHYRNGRRYYRSRAYPSRYYRCRRGRGTTGMIIGGAAGALIGRELDHGYNRATGTILGAAGGALLGREVARNRRCR
jgi:uncharacterized protein YcfJ